MKILSAVLFLVLSAEAAFAGDDLKLNPKLNYNSDSEDGALITGVNMDAGFVQREARVHHSVRRRMLQLQATGAADRGVV